MPEPYSFNHARELLVVAATIFVAELADKTQLAAFGFAATSNLSKLEVWLAACFGLAVATGLAILLASWVAPFVAQYNINRLGGVLFVAIGMWMIFGK